MKLSLGLVTLFFATAFGQVGTSCPKELARTNECADVINANACYNQNRFRNKAGTLGCIEGANDAEKQKKVR